MSVLSAAVTRTNSEGKLLFVCKHCDESIGHPSAVAINKLVHVTTGKEECHPITTAEKKLVELAHVQAPNIKEPVSIANSLVPSFNDVIKELTSYYAEPVRSPSGKAKPDAGCKYCGKVIYWDGVRWEHSHNEYSWTNPWRQCKPEDITEYRGE